MPQFNALRYLELWVKSVVALGTLCCHVRGDVKLVVLTSSSAMKKTEHLLLINRICDEFEAKLKLDAGSEIAAHLQSIEGSSQDSEFYDYLLIELVALKIDYSEDRQATADLLRSRYPHHEEQIQNALELQAMQPTMNTALDTKLGDLVKAVYQEGHHHESSVSGDHAGRKEPLATVIPIGESMKSGSRFVGKYKLLQPIGEGGMGTVWMAEQEKPVRRRVALKIIKSDFVDKQAIARFEIESQVLAMMDHQNIAKVLDAGTSDHGSPYFVMELVKGDPVTRYCDTNELTPAQRLKLFLQACDAVQHAHHKGIIHRDLKPSNILVHVHNGEPTVKVIDFGLAKALDRHTKLTDKTLFTRFGSVVGTVQYMSPEQARADAVDIDTRTDIYSLGAVLYELLVGSTPVEKGIVDENSLLRVLEIIRDDEPPRPSVRLASLTPGEQSSIGAQRRIQPAKLQHVLRGELDWIIMRALDKVRSRRYATPNDFSEDIRRYLDGDAVVARPPSAGYRFRKFVRKNKVPVAIVAGLFAVVAGAAIMIAGALANANVARARSERILRIVGESFKATDPNYSDATAEMSARDVLKNAQDSLEQSDLDDLGKIHLLSQLSNSFSGLGEFELALRAAELSHELATATLNRDHVDAIAATHNLANAYYDAGKPNESIELFEKALELRVARLGSDHPDTLVTMTGLATALYVGGQSVEAVKLYEKAIELSKRSLGAADPNTLGLMNRLAFGYTEIGKIDEAIELFRRTLEKRIATLGPEHPETFWSMEGLAFACAQAGRTDESIELSEKTLDLRTRRLGPRHPNTLRTMQGLANAYRDAGRIDEAIDLHRKTLKLRIDRIGPKHVDTMWSMNNLAATYKAASRTEEAVELYEQTLQLQRSSLGEDHPATLWSMDGLGYAYEDAGRMDEAIELHRQTLELRTAKLGPDHIQTLRSIDGLATAYDHTGRTEEAIELFQQAIELRRAKFGPTHADTQRSATQLAWVLSTISPRDSRLDEELVDLVRLACDENPEGSSLQTLAAAEYRIGNFAKAIAAAKGSLELEPELASGTGFAIMAMSHLKLGDLAEANEYRKNLGDAMEKDAFSKDAKCVFFAAEVDELFKSGSMGEDQ